MNNGGWMLFLPFPASSAARPIKMVSDTYCVQGRWGRTCAYAARQGTGPLLPKAFKWGPDGQYSWSGRRERLEMGFSFLSLITTDGLGPIALGVGRPEHLRMLTSIHALYPEYQQPPHASQLQRSKLSSSCKSSSSSISDTSESRPPRL